MVGAESDTAANHSVSGLKRLVDVWLLDLAHVVMRIFSSQRRRRTTLYKSLDGLAIVSKSGRKIGTIAAEANSSQSLERAAAMLKKAWMSRNGIVLKLADDQVLAKQLTFPAAVRGVLDPVVRNQLQSIVPWPADETCFGYRITGQSRDKIEVSLAAMRQDQIDAIQHDAAAARIGVARIETTSLDAKSKPITLYDVATGKRETLAGAIGRMLGLLFVLALLGATFGGYHWFEAARNNGALTKTIDRVSAGLANRSEGSKVVDLADDLSSRKSRAAMSLSVLNALSETIPDQAYLSNLTIKKGTLLISGRADDAAALIASLERSGRFQSVRFGGPTIREIKGGKEAFTIEAKILGFATSRNITSEQGNDR